MVAPAARMSAAPMIWTLQDVLTATAGCTVAAVDAGEGFATVSTDSRTVAPDGLFVALHGARYDGHAFVAEAFQRGAAYALVDHRPEGVSECRLIVVRDTTRALGDLAAWTRRQHPLRVVAVTGSNGKTTTKEMIAAICRAAAFPPPHSRVLQTEGNYNNLIGLPLTLLQLRGDEAVAVLEMGMNRLGEIARLTEIAGPDYAVITNVAPAHLEGVGGTLAAVARAKGELFAGLSSQATIAVNLEDEWVRRLATAFPGRKVTFGDAGDVQARDIRELAADGVAFALGIGDRSARVRLRLVGRHNVRNAVAAAAVGHAMGLGLEIVARGLEEVSGPAMRMQVVRLDNGVTLINDAYNANPSSVEAALVALRRLSGRSVAVLGEMRELGDEARRAHHYVGERAAALGVEELFLLGDLAEDMAAGARAGGLRPAAVHVCGSHAEAAAAVVARWQPGDRVLVKGSRGMKMEAVVRLLEGAGRTP